MKYKQGLIFDIEKETLSNNNFRKVIYTGPNSQLVLMSIPPREDIGMEIHDVDQFFKVEQGNGICIVNGVEHKFNTGFSITIPAKTKHNIINTGKTDLKMYTVYSPPNHKDGVIHKTKDEASKDEEHFDGNLTENVSNKLSRVKHFLEWSTLGNVTSQNYTLRTKNELNDSDKFEPVLTADKKVKEKKIKNEEKRINKMKKILFNNK